MTDLVQSMRFEVKGAEELSRYQEEAKRLGLALDVLDDKVAGISVAFSESKSALGAASGALSSLYRQYVDNYSATQDLERGLRTLNSGIMAGKVNNEQLAQAVAGLTQKYGLSSAAVSEITAKFGTLKDRMADASVQTQIAATEQKNQATALQAMVDRINPASAALKQIASDQEALNAAYAAQKIDLTTHTQLTMILNKQAEAHNKVAGSAKLSFQSQEILKSGIINTVQSLIAGQSALEVLTVQGSQTAPVLAEVSTAMMGTVGAIAAGVVAVGAAALAWDGYLSRLREVARVNALMGGASGTTENQRQAMARAAAEKSGVSVITAQNLQSSFISNQIDSSLWGKITGMSRDFAAATGTDAATAGDNLAKMFYDPSKAAADLTAQYNLLSAAELDHIKHLAAEGDRTGALTDLTSKFESRIKGLAENTSGWSRLIEQAGIKISNAWAGVGAAIDNAINGPSIEKQIALLEEKKKRSADYDLTDIGAVRDAPFNEQDDEKLRSLLEEKGRKDAKAYMDGLISEEIKKSNDAVEGLSALNPMQSALEKIKETISKVRNGTETGMVPENLMGSQGLDRLTQQSADYQKAIDDGLTIEEEKRRQILAVQQRAAAIEDPGARDRYLAQESARIDLLGTATTAQERARAAAAALLQVETQTAQARTQYAIDTKYQIADQNRLADAWTHGADAARQMAVANTVIAQIHSQHAESDPAAQGRIIAAETAKDLATRQAAMAQLGAEQAQANTLAQAEYQTLTLTDAERAKALAMIQTANDLQAKGVDWTKEGTQEYLKQVGAMAEYKARLAENTQAAQGFASSIGGALETSLLDPAAKFSDVWGKAFSDIRKQVLDMVAIKPFEQWLTGNLTQALTGAPPAGGGTPVVTPADIGEAVAVGLQRQILSVYVTNDGFAGTQPGLSPSTAAASDYTPSALTRGLPAGVDAAHFESIVYGILQQESSGNVNAISGLNRNGTRDYGLMQVNSANFKELKVDIQSVMDPITNINAGVQELKNWYIEGANNGLSGASLDQYALQHYNAGYTGADTSTYRDNVLSNAKDYASSLQEGEQAAKFVATAFGTLATAAGAATQGAVAMAQGGALAGQGGAYAGNALASLLGLRPTTSGASSPIATMLAANSNSSGGLLSGLGGGGSNNTLSGLYDGSYLQSILQPDSYAQSLFGAGQSLSSTGDITSLASGAGGAAGSMSGLGSGLMGALGVGQGLMGLMSGQGGAGGVVSNASSIIGGGLGIASAMGLGASLGPIGMGVGLVGGLIGNLIGGGQKSVGPNADANLNTDNGRFNFGAAAGDNGGDPAQAKAAIDQVTTQMNAVLDKYKLTVSPYWGGISSGNGGGGGFKDAASLVADIIGSHVMSGDGLVGRAAANTSAKDVQGLTSDLDFASTLQKSIDAIHNFVSASDEQKRATNATTTAVIAQYQADQARADGLGLRAEEDKKISSDITFQLQQMGATEAPLSAAAKAAADFTGKLTGIKTVADSVGAAVDTALYSRAISAKMDSMIAALAPTATQAQQAVADLNVTLAGLQEAAAATGAVFDSSKAGTIIQAELNSMIAALAPAATPTEQALADLSTKIDGLKTAAKTAGANIGDALFDSVTTQVKAKIVLDLNTSQTSNYNSATGNDFVNKISDLYTKLVADIKSAQTLGQSSFQAKENANVGIASVLQGLTSDQIVTALTTYGAKLVPLVEAEEARRVALQQNTEKLNAANSAVSYYTSAITSLHDFTKGLNTSDLSPLSPLDKYNAAKDKLTADQKAAMSGDQAAFSRIQSESTDFLNASKAYNATNTQYAQDFASVTAFDASLETVAQQQLDMQTKMVATLQGTIATDLDKINAAISKLGITPVVTVNVTTDANGKTTTTSTTAGGAGGTGVTVGDATQSLQDASIAYMNNNQDVLSAWVNNSQGMTEAQFAQDHYSRYGALEGRSFGGATNAASAKSMGLIYFAERQLGTFGKTNALDDQQMRAVAYMNNNPDVLSAYNAGTLGSGMNIIDAARLHYQTYGAAEGRAFAKGGVFYGGNVIPFARGGVIDQPMLFPMAGGATGLMGEAGPEAIMPLRRGPSGALGVVATTGTGNGELVAEIRALRAEVAALRAVTGTGHGAVRDAIVEGNALTRANDRSLLRNAGR